MTLPAAFLAVPAPGDAGLASLLRKVRLLAVRTLLNAHGGGSLRAVQRVLPGILRASPDAALDAIGEVDVLLPLLMLGDGQGPAIERLREAVPPLLAGLAARGLLDEAVLWTEPVAVLVDTARSRAFRFEPPAKALLAHRPGLEVERGDGTRDELDRLAPERPFHTIAPGLHLATIDTNPLHMIEEHPDKAGNAIDLGGRSPGEWVAALQAALDLVRIGLPTWHAELPLALRRLIPVGYEPQKHLSASYREAPGLAYLTLHPDPVTLAEAIVHETQHGKLNLLSWLDPVLHNGRTFWTTSPVRPDLRPLMGVLLAVHAFVPVAALHAGLAAAGHPLALTPTFANRRLQVIAGNERGLALVREHGEPTAVGRRVVDGLSALHRVLADLAPAERDPEALPPG